MSSSIEMQLAPIGRVGAGGCVGAGGRNDQVGPTVVVDVHQAYLPSGVVTGSIATVEDNFAQAVTQVDNAA